MKSIVHVIAAAFVCSAFALADNQDQLEISPDSEKIIKEKGAGVILTCSANVQQKNLISNLRWLDAKNNTIDERYIQENTKFRARSTQKGLQLLIQSLQESMVGVYTCAAEYDTKTISRSIRVGLFQPITFVDAPEKQLARKGERNFKLKCNVQAQPSPSVSWYRGDAQITSNNKYIIESDGLTIRDITEVDDDSYRCEVSVVENGALQSRTIKLEVISDPVFFGTPEAINVTEGESATIFCNATGKPQPTFSWVKGTTKKNLTHSLTYNGRYTIERVVKEDNDVFTCVATNSAGTVQRDVRVNVQSKPQVIETVNTTIVTGRNGELKCYVYGNPLPNVTIRRLGHKNHDTNDVRFMHTLVRDSKGRQNVVEAILRLDNVERSDDGLYECVASNGIGGETVSNLHLTVEYKPFFQTSAMVNKVVTWEKRSVNMTCFAQAIPNATISWYFNTNPIALVSDSSYVFFTSTGQSILQVTPLKDVYGSYKCKAVNPHGEERYEIKLVQGFKPEVIRAAHINTTTATSITFEFIDPSSTGNLPIKAYIVQYTEQSSRDWNLARRVVWPVGGPYILTDLMPGTRYMFRFASQNEVGTSQWGGEQEAETPQRSVPSEPILSSRALDGDRFIKSPFANRIELRWTIPSSNGFDIDRYIVRTCPITEETIEGGEPNQNGCKSTEIPYTTILSSYVVESLNPNTLYRVQLSAHNSLGLSIPSTRIYKTNDVDQPGSHTASEHIGEIMNTGLSSVVIIYIVVALLVGFLVIVDIFCFFVGKTGVIYTLCGSCCLRKKKKDDKLGSESRDLITNGLKNKVDIEEQSPMITDGTKRDTAVEYDVKKGVSKTGFVGKDSAV